MRPSISILRSSVLVLLASALLTACGGPLRYAPKGTPKAPETDAHLIAAVDEKANITHITITAEHLAPPGRLQDGGTTYVVWTRKDDGGVWQRVGALDYDEGDRTGGLRRPACRSRPSISSSASRSKPPRRRPRATSCSSSASRTEAQPSHLRASLRRDRGSQRSEGALNSPKKNDLADAGLFLRGGLALGPERRGLGLEIREPVAHAPVVLDLHVAAEGHHLARDLLESGASPAALFQACCSDASVISRLSIPVSTSRSRPRRPFSRASLRSLIGR